MSSSQQYTESMSHYSHSSSSSEKKNVNSLLDEDFLKEEEFIDNYIEASLREKGKSKYHQDESSTNISVKAIKGNSSTGKQDKIIEGFQKVTVSSGSNEVNHFSRSISHDPENDFTQSSDEEEDFVSEDVIVPVKDMEKEKSKRWSFGVLDQHKDREMVNEEPIVPMREWKYPNDSLPPNKLFEEVTLNIPSTTKDHSDGRINITKSPRDKHPDFETRSSRNNSLRVDKNVPVEIQVSKEVKNHIQIHLSPNQQQDSGFRPIQSSSTEQHRQQHHQIIKIKPTAVRKTSNSSTDGQVVFKQQIYFQDHLEQMRQSESHEQRRQIKSHEQMRQSESHDVKQIKHMRKSSLPEDSEFRRETDFQLQQQRDLQQRMSQRQHNESRKSIRKHEDSETFKQQQYHQQKLMQHQQHLQRIQQQQQQQKEKQTVDKHSHVVLNGRVMRRHSFDNSSLLERRQIEEERRNLEESNKRQVKTLTRDRQQTRERRFSYEQECDKLEEELHRLQEREARKQNNQQQQHQQQQQQKQRQLQNYQQQTKQHQQQQYQEQHQQQLQTVQITHHHQQYQQQQQHHQHQQHQQNQIQNHQQLDHHQQLDQQHQQHQVQQPNNNFNRHQTRHEDLLQQHPQRFISQSATNTPNLQQNRKLDPFLTPDPPRKRGKIPNSLKFQSEDIINPQSKTRERRKSNPNIILGRTDINKEKKEQEMKNISHTLPRSFGRQKKSKVSITFFHR